jgi:8-oxo-dGTP pyrophosphatase MutT (NUDIX family)
MNNNLTQTAFVYLEKNGYVLLLQEGGHLAKGLWCFPGGHVDEGESFSEAAIREALEESGYEVKLEKIIYKSLISNLDYKGSSDDAETVEIVIFKGLITGGNIRLDDQALDIKWLKKEEAITLPLRWEFLKELILNN